MGSQIGNQKILWRYKTALIAKDLATMQHGILYPGVYGGGLVVTLSAGLDISAGELLINSVADDEIVKIVFQDAFNIPIGAYGAGNIFVIVRFTWYNTETNYYAEVLIKDAASLLSTDVILAVLEWDGTHTSVIAVDNSSKTFGINTHIDDLVLGLKPTAKFDAVRQIDVAAGNFVFSGDNVEFAGGNTTSMDASPSQRCDVIGIDSAGNLVIDKGTDGSLTPNTYGAYLPVAEVNIYNGHDIILQDNITDVRPYFFFGGTVVASAVSFDDSGNTYVLGSTVQQALDATDVELVSHIGDNITGSNIVHGVKQGSGNGFDADKVDGANLSTSTSLGTSNILIPSQNAVKSYVDNRHGFVLRTTTGNSIAIPANAPDFVHVLLVSGGGGGGGGGSWAGNNSYGGGAGGGGGCGAARILHLDLGSSHSFNCVIGAGGGGGGYQDASGANGDDGGIGGGTTVTIGGNTYSIFNLGSSKGIGGSGASGGGGGNGGNGGSGLCAGGGGGGGASGGGGGSAGSYYILEATAGSNGNVSFGGAGGYGAGMDGSGTWSPSNPKVTMVYFLSIVYPYIVPPNHTLKAGTADLGGAGGAGASGFIDFSIQAGDGGTANGPDVLGIGSYGGRGHGAGGGGGAGGASGTQNPYIYRGGEGGNGRVGMVLVFW